MRGVAVLIVYLLGLGAIVSFGIAGLMVLHSSTTSMSSAPATAVTPHKGWVAKPVRQTTQKDAQSNQKRKTVKATRKRIKEEPTISSSGLDAYGYANEPRPFYPNPFRFFGHRE